MTLQSKAPRLRAEWCPYSLDFRFEARTSRAVMHQKDTYFIRLHDEARPELGAAIGEVPLFRGLSAEDNDRFEDSLAQACKEPLKALTCGVSAIEFGFESALRSLYGSASTPWTRGECGIPINGLVWMGDKHTMAERISQKLDAGFKVLKLKIGGIDFEDEMALLEAVRRKFSPADLEIRVDANGAFSPHDCMRHLERLAPLALHSIEQPIKAGQPDEMAAICAVSPVPVALDEELIGCRTLEESIDLVNRIAPAYLVLKPALCGGFRGAENYIFAAEMQGIGWWATSALESDIGLFAIARWLSEKQISIPQGLGTGQLYHNNIPSPLYMRNAEIWCDYGGKWGDMDSLPWRD